MKIKKQNKIKKIDLLNLFPKEKLTTIEELEKFLKGKEVIYSGSAFLKHIKKINEIIDYLND